MIYLDDNENTSASQDTSVEMEDKSNIHIKKSRQGSFTKWCKQQGFSGVTQECIQKGLKSKNPAIRKKANFARNARKWNKGK